MVYMMLNVIGGDNPLQLHYFHLVGVESLSGPHILAMLCHLACLHTFIFSCIEPKDTYSAISSDQQTTNLLNALSPHNQDFHSACPQLATVILTNIYVLKETFLNFVHQCMQSDSEELTPSLVRCFVMDQVWNTFWYIRRLELHWGQEFWKSSSTELWKRFRVRGT